ncbi:THO complex subunit 3-like [Phragmites australis]|uniref:THO complex subunit 3-like n=1 Tax=Phragmites australis TaxID=29695 RepID=UPI002D783E41|nr:THO complex subunit 3-like [Phragmites australis]
MEGKEEERKGSGGAGATPATAGASTPGMNLRNLVSREYYGHKKKVHSVAWNCLGTKLASGSIDHTARVWSIDPHGHPKVKDIELKGHTDSVDQLCWDPKHPDTVATAAADKSIRLWDTRSGKYRVVELSGENINITYKHDGTAIAVGNKEDQLTILDVRMLKATGTHKFNYEINEIAWNKTGDLFFITTGLGHVEVVKDLDFQKSYKLNAHTAGCYCIAMDPLDRYFAVGSADSLVSLWNVKELLCIKTFSKLEWPVRTVSFNHTGEFIAYASEDPFIDIANVETGRSIHHIPCKAAMNSVEWNPKYDLLAYAGDDKNKYLADEGVFRIFGFETHN